MAGVNEDQAIQQWLSLTSGSTNEARQYLEMNEWNVEDAVASYFDDAEDDNDEPEPEFNQPAAAQPGLVSGGGRTLAGGSAQASSTRSQPSSSSRPAQRRTGLATLGDYSGGGQGHGHDRDDSDDDDQDPGQNMFAGGEKSGLAVQNPNSSNNPRDLLDRVFKRAQENIPRPGGDDEPAATQNFSGRGVTLGGDDAPSTVIEDPLEQARQRGQGRAAQGLPRVTRTLHIWNNGFSIDDGPLMDPAASEENARILRMILSGQAPISILNVQPGQEVDLQLDNQKDNPYVQPKKKYVPFGGSGQRLGDDSSAPASASATTTTSVATAAAPGTPSTASGSDPASVTVDSSQPTITLQLRLGDGTRLQSRFNTTHTIGDVYDFVGAASPTSRQRAFVLSSTFPPKDFEDQSAVLGDLAEFKRGGVMVQKWKQ